jgi:hypothetical protein
VDITKINVNAPDNPLKIDKFAAAKTFLVRELAVLKIKEESGVGV